MSSEDVDWSEVGGIDGADVISIHGGNKETADRVDGPRVYYEENELYEGVYKIELEFQYFSPLDLFQIYSEDGVNEIVSYEHKEGNPIIVWGHSLGGDSILEAYGRGSTSPDYSTFSLGSIPNISYTKPQEKADELNIVMPRVNFIEKYLEKVSKNTEQINLYMLEGDSPLSGIIPFYGDRSYETLEDKISSGNIKIPDNVNIIRIPKLKEGHVKESHGEAINHGDIINERILKEYNRLRKESDKK